MFSKRRFRRGNKPGQNNIFENTSETSKQKVFFPAVQTKLNVGKPGDAFEQEADQKADEVVSRSVESNILQRMEGEEQEVQAMPMANSITPFVQKQESKEEEVQSKTEPEEEGLQKMEEEEAVQQKEEEEVQAKCEECEEEEVQKMEEEEPVQQKEIEEEPVQKQEEASVQKQEEEEVQAKSNTAKPGRTSNIQSQLQTHRGGGSPMQAKVRNEMEGAFGSGFGNVRIHTGGYAQEMTKSMGAQAFTNGYDIYFNKGKYSPESLSGKHLLAHELTHTIQQKGTDQVIQKSCSDPDFCTPYPTISAAISDEIWLRMTLLPMMSGLFGSEVHDLWRDYMLRTPASGLTPRIFRSGDIADSFADSFFTDFDMEIILQHVKRSFYTSFSPSTLVPGVTHTEPLSTFVSPSILNHRTINYSNPASRAGNIAGGISGSAAGPDYRKIISGEVNITKHELAFGHGYYSIEITANYEVGDALDFCPGGCGSLLESQFTVPLSRLEASGMAYDLPFKVFFTPPVKSGSIFF